MSNSRNTSRRELLKWLGASPLFLNATSLLTASELPKDPMVWKPGMDLNQFYFIKDPADAINVFDFEIMAYKNVPVAHFGFMVSGIDDEVTLRENRQAFLKYQLLPRRMRNVSEIDMSINLFGKKWPSPLIIAPTGGNRAYNPMGEIAVAKAAKNGNYLNILSNAASTSYEDVVAAREGDVWFQLYATEDFNVAKQVVQRVQKAGCPVLEITTDLIATRNLETFFRFRRADTRVCSNCHVDGPGSFRDRPNYDNINVSKALGMQDTRMTWDFIKKIRDITQMKIVLKGILTEQDARLCLKYGVDGIHVSNHGGRAEDNMRGSLECLPDIVKVAKGKLPILFDSGVRRGTDVFKAIALGADGVCIGRPYLWGLGAFGQPGVEKVMDIIRHELFSIMQQMGTTSLKEINMQYLVKTTGVQAGAKEL